LTRKGNITESIRAETGLEYQLILAVQRLKDEYAQREAAMNERLDILSGQVNGLERADRELDAATERFRATGASFAAGIQDWLERRFWERFYGDEELER
jgi:RNase P/RNase MRP subunit p30